MHFGFINVGVSHLPRFDINEKIKGIILQKIANLQSKRTNFELRKRQFD